MKAIEVKNLSKTFMINSSASRSLKNTLLNVFGGNQQKLTVLDDISFNIKKGEFVGIIGQNGCGKSTLLKILANIINPDSGEVKIDGRISPFLELGVGFQEELSAIDNVYLYGSLLGMTKSQMNERLEDIIAFSELEKFVNTPLKHFSSGMYVRLAFSVAIHADFDILLLDEVLAVGDVGFQQKCFQKFEKMKKQQKTIIFVSHNLKSILKFSDKVLWIENGKLKASGKPKQVVNQFLQSGILSKMDNSKNKNKVIKEVKCSKTEYSQKEKITISIKHDSEKLSSKVNFGIGIYSENLNEYLFGYSTFLDKIKITPSSKGEVITTINNHNLLPGKYYANIVCFVDNEAKFIDFVGLATRFKITGKKKYRGLVELNHGWKTKPN